MGWVTLALRKASLKQEHSYYQLRLLQISREKRQMARRKSYESQSILNDQNQALAPLKETYYGNRQSIMDEIKQTREAAKAAGEDISTYTNGNGKTVADLQMELSNAQLDYQEQVNDEKTFYEDELAILEEEAADEELILDQEQIEVETQMEAISQELQAVSEAVSAQIQSSTIKLA